MYNIGNAHNTQTEGTESKSILGSMLGQFLYGEEKHSSDEEQANNRTDEPRVQEEYSKTG